MQISSKALAAGCAPSDVINDHTIKTLRNRSVRWLVEVYNAINEPKLIKKFFELCAVSETNLNLSEFVLGDAEAPSGEEDDDPEFELSHPELNCDITVPELIGHVLKATHLSGLPGSLLGGNDDLDGFESGELEYSRPACLSKRASKTSRARRVVQENIVIGPSASASMGTGDPSKIRVASISEGTGTNALIVIVHLSSTATVASSVVGRRGSRDSFHRSILGYLEMKDPQAEETGTL
ncbi:hypothetical protein BDV93DRAFT_512907 [Ceratobasidium sp. AG-I]|nr:hypothetical protein BDV93DRAFT_512907 [Ceratobasidium sp. AG-I]